MLQGGGVVVPELQLRVLRQERILQLLLLVELVREVVLQLHLLAHDVRRHLCSGHIASRLVLHLPQLGHGHGAWCRTGPRVLEVRAPAGGVRHEQRVRRGAVGHVHAGHDAALLVLGARLPHRAVVPVVIRVVVTLVVAGHAQNVDALHARPPHHEVAVHGRALPVGGLVLEVLGVALERAEAAEADAAGAREDLAARFHVHGQVLLDSERLFVALAALVRPLALEVASQEVLLRLVLGGEDLGTVGTLDRRVGVLDLSHPLHRLALAVRGHVEDEVHLALEALPADVAHEALVVLRQHGRLLHATTRRGKPSHGLGPRRSGHDGPTRTRCRQRRATKCCRRGHTSRQRGPGRARLQCEGARLLPGHGPGLVHRLHVGRCSAHEQVRVGRQHVERGARCAHESLARTLSRRVRPRRRRSRRNRCCRHTRGHRRGRRHLCAFRYWCRGRLVHARVRWYRGGCG
mmetsp:Transcript_21730/g.58526  ORF Transcript_21730/g.58526 Transcript_21730/m.58526 type:complete len:462 (-) Transcript_21730:271-1656(-)